MLASVLPSARKRGMKTICWFEDVWSRDVPNVAQAQEKQLDGQNAGTLCFNNPNYRNWLLGTVEDYTRSWEIDGIMWGSERQGAFSNMTRGVNPGGVTCFCPFCERKARERGIDVARARAGFRALGEFTRGGKRPVDGYYVTLWRLMLRYPELLAWENLWHDSLRETYAAIYAKVKSIKPGVGVGWHIWHQNSFTPIYRAEQDLTELAKYSDFLKMVMYHNCGGERLAGYIGQVGRTIYGDVPAAGAARLPLPRAGLPGRKADGGSRQSGPVERLRVPRGQARARRAGRGENAALARHRYRYPHRRHVVEIHARRHARRGPGGFPGRRRRRDPLPQMERNESRQPERRRRRHPAGAFFFPFTVAAPLGAGIVPKALTFYYADPT